MNGSPIEVYNKSCVSCVYFEPELPMEGQPNGWCRHGIKRTIIRGGRLYIRWPMVPHVEYGCSDHETGSASGWGMPPNPWAPYACEACGEIPFTHVSREAEGWGAYCPICHSTTLDTNSKWDTLVWHKQCFESWKEDWKQFCNDTLSNVLPKIERDLLEYGTIITQWGADTLVLRSTKFKKLSDQLADNSDEVIQKMIEFFDVKEVKVFPR